MLKHASESGPNWELIDATLEAIRRNKTRFNMRSFVSECGTTMCFAGWALSVSGHNISREGWDLYIDGKLADIETAAAKVLNISDQAASNIFFLTWIGDDVDKLEEKIDRILGPRG